MGVNKIRTGMSDMTDERSFSDALESFSRLEFVRSDRTISRISLRARDDRVDRYCC